MIGLGMGLGIGRRRRIGFDPEAAAYFTRATVTDPTSQSLINSFIQGAKAGGYWSLMDEAWLLRATQNAGSGATAFALKSNANNGTLVNAPAWGANGIAFTAASSQKITTAFAPTGGEVTVLGTHNPTAGAANMAIAVQDDIVNRRWELNYLGATDQGNWAVFNPGLTGPSITSAEGAFRSLIGRCGASLSAIHDFVNAETTAAAGAINAVSTALWIGARQNGAGDFFYNGTIAHVLYFSTVLSDPQKAHLYANIKATIGSGLILP